MSQFFQIHPENPQARLIKHAAEIIESGGVIAYPTDSAYALGCHLGDKKAADKIRQIRKLNEKHNFTLVCRDLTDISTYAKVDNQQYRQIKAHTPGPYTFILDATTEVPRRLMNPKRRQIGIRIPDNEIALALLEELGQPIMSTTLILPGDDMPMTDPYEVRSLLEHTLDLVIDGGFCGFEATSVVNLSGEETEIVRKGCGDISAFEG
ncbi:MULTISPECIES: L-threonylcarbamoyladenylate synthase [unclassified Oleiphilus]|jgi:tRNA threonylcarbamoyl adenosine modification protein (Sua5/YciO/YrdC/YwlC family)|uniref:L-threonylcarbamoyladenylate synthase n=1 Tax=unclassified Oleiphilus TaxID=2631174 RepID=UPI0007C33800|nr:MULTISPECIES: L-threonylcarbamoyladenylate synthase [unclassified Oleiphilus]KZY40205.1 threonylcarbamoyl-AMP synthase [Oleiphilus sp. HI0050]KZY77826.1 threonylcarbamoyl-AMP synthase [Oleiphilus sp. HI0068]KZY83889.1 threonylcarbamoyl-AMP synthase [Oleiphilus sp. HI0069]KZY92771.1 threonylcarbamoyl-AMP synthase [Oleiphilus sp. HI0072]KZZ09463.1 threonylcarbamoyl-AMP synthase [Oleiphilus sp. HI0078]KZZ19615.1 threonylcarbamoyl-AMP synthase [Oleiphilus sp. HI0081]KZZ45153.1 threonylcarbamo